MSHIEVDIELSGRGDAEQEFLLALLADFGFNGFRQEEGRILAYMEAERFSPEAFESFLGSRVGKEKIRSCRTTEIPQRNWNEIWERNYSPVNIRGRCQVRAPFHPPPEGVQYDLVISPKMSFGTAHHETTRGMIECMLEHEWQGKRLLDFGCGTAVLAILAEKMGARSIIALDHDPGACSSARENIAANHCSNIRVVRGTLAGLEEQALDAVLANINLNVLLKEMQRIGRILLGGGLTIMSGFYQTDAEKLNRAAREAGLQPLDKKVMNNWMVGVYRKEN